MSKIARDTSTYLGVNLTAQLFSILRGTIVARVLGPVYFGIWDALQVILDYSPYFGLGVPNAMSREYPYRVGKNELSQAGAIKNTAFTFNILINTAVALLLVGIIVFLKLKISSEIAIGVLVISLVSILQQASVFYRELGRLEKRINSVNIALLLFSGINCLVSILLVRRFSIYSLYLALVIAYIISLAYLIYVTKNKFRFSIDKDHLRRLVKLGLTLTMIPILTTALQNLDKLLILKFLNIKYLGFYGLGSLFAGLILYLPVAYQFITYPYLLEGHGQKVPVSDLGNLYVAQPTMAMAGLLAFCIGAMLISVNPVIKYLLPNYLDSLKTLKILLVSGFFFSQIYLSANFLVAMNKQVKVIKLQVICLLLQIGFGFFFIRAGASINGVAWARCIAYFILGSSLLGYALIHSLIKISSVVYYLLRIYLFLAYALLTVFVLEKASLSFADTLINSLMKLIIYIFVCGVPLYLSARSLQRRIRLKP